jgi:hypothetical protein
MLLKVLSIEQKAAYAARARARSADPLIRAKISATLTGRKNGPRSEETKALLSALRKGKPGMPGAGRPKGTTVKVVVDSNGNLYYGLEEVALKFGLAPSTICHILAGRRPNTIGIKEFKNGNPTAR